LKILLIYGCSIVNFWFSFWRDVCWVGINLRFTSREVIGWVVVVANFRLPFWEICGWVNDDFRLLSREDVGLVTDGLRVGSRDDVGWIGLYCEDCCIISPVLDGIVDGTLVVLFLKKLKYLRFFFF